MVHFLGKGYSKSDLFPGLVEYGIIHALISFANTVFVWRSSLCRCFPGLAVLMAEFYVVWYGIILMGHARRLW